MELPTLSKAINSKGDQTCIVIAKCATKIDFSPWLAGGTRPDKHYAQSSYRELTKASHLDIQCGAAH
jgi:hypothetical protein